MDPETDLQRRQLCDRLSSVLCRLSPRDERALRLRYGLSGGEPMIYDEIAAAFGFTNVRAQQICNRAIRRLKKHKRALAQAGGLEVL